MAALWGHHLEGEKWDGSLGKGVEGALRVEGMSHGSRKSGSEPPEQQHSGFCTCKAPSVSPVATAICEGLRIVQSKL